MWQWIERLISLDALALFTLTAFAFILGWYLGTKGHEKDRR